MSNTRTELRKRAERELATRHAQASPVVLRLLDAVLASGLTMREISRRSGVPASSISRLAGGGDLSGESIDALARTLGLELKPMREEN
jgi:predicted transcriptional regulator